MPLPLPFSSASPLIIALALSCAFLYTVYGAVYRLYLSPIAKFPGPRFAALTFWNEFWYDVVRGGRYTWKIAEYHERYGECFRSGWVVRISEERGECRRDWGFFAFLFFVLHKDGCDGDDLC